MLSLALSTTLSLCLFLLLFSSLFHHSSYLLGQLPGEELVELGVEDAVGDELFFLLLLLKEGHRIE
jgi:hypothetical protein